MSDENTKLTIKDQLDSFIKAYPKAKTLSCTFNGSGDSFESFDDICAFNKKGLVHFVVLVIASTLLMTFAF